MNKITKLHKCAVRLMICVQGILKSQPNLPKDKYIIRS